MPRSIRARNAYSPRLEIFMFYSLRSHSSNAPRNPLVYGVRQKCAEEKNPNQSISFAVSWPALLVNLYFFTMVFMRYYRSRKSKSIIFFNFCWAASDFDGTNAKIAGPAQATATNQGSNHPGSATLRNYSQTRAMSFGEKTLAELEVSSACYRALHVMWKKYGRRRRHRTWDLSTPSLRSVRREIYFSCNDGSVQAQQNQLALWFSLAIRFFE